MTFILKDYNDLKRDFAQTVSIMLEREGKKTINELSSLERKEQLLFLKDVITTLDTKINQATPTVTGKTKHQSIKGLEVQKALAIRYEAAQILYGAMSLIATRITNDMTIMQAGSLLRDRLLVDMGITTTHKPSDLQYKNCYRHLNHFFSLLFNEHDSRHGINQQNELTHCDISFVVKLMRESHEQEKQYFKYDLEQFTEEGQPWTDQMALHFGKKGFVIPFEWTTLKGELNKLIIAQLADKNVAEIALLNPSRAAQLHFLERIHHTLDSLSEVHIPSSLKAAILAGAMHIVREQISLEYRKQILNFEETGSLIHDRLGSILSNATSPEQIDTLVNAAQHFILYLTTDSQKFRSEHRLAGIEGFSLINTLKLSQDILYAARIKALNGAYKQYKKEQKSAGHSNPEHASPSGMSGFFNSMFFRSHTTSSQTATNNSTKDEAIAATDTPSPR